MKCTVHVLIGILEWNLSSRYVRSAMWVAWMDHARTHTHTHTHTHRAVGRWQQQRDGDLAPLRLPLGACPTAKWVGQTGGVYMYVCVIGEERDTGLSSPNTMSVEWSTTLTWLLIEPVLSAVGEWSVLSQACFVKGGEKWLKGGARETPGDVGNRWKNLYRSKHKKDNQWGF